MVLNPGTVTPVNKHGWTKSCTQRVILKDGIKYIYLSEIPSSQEASLLLSMPMGVDYVVIGFDMEVQP